MTRTQQRLAILINGDSMPFDPGNTSSCMDSSSLSELTFLSSDLRATSVFLLSSSTFSYSSRVISFTSGSFSYCSFAEDSLLASLTSSCTGSFLASVFFSPSLIGSSVYRAISSVGTPQFPRPDPSITCPD
ncbi:unnamed protein product [Fraxinus pennsylvanica]|uniref:Uncharacterized protein n=1 Tax=Fraxinus pennsylvanica TaxID=56036 RepID=A0AAD2E6W4_9LAMI|nr:unnamed protein product [Fraxinus pennsylvanica]